MEMEVTEVEMEEMEATEVEMEEMAVVTDYKYGDLFKYIYMIDGSLMTARFAQFIF